VRLESSRIKELKKPQVNDPVELLRSVETDYSTLWSIEENELEAILARNWSKNGYFMIRKSR
jgi:hypothetical protein